MASLISSASCVNLDRLLNLSVHRLPPFQGGLRHIKTRRLKVDSDTVGPAQAPGSIPPVSGAHLEQSKGLKGFST